MTTPVIAVFGAGTGLGASVARRFGREGFRVALVGRRPEPLEHLAADLGAYGIEAAPFTADLGDPANARDLVDAVRARFGRIDVIEYGPASADLTITPARDLSARALQQLADLYLLTPVELTRLVLPELLERSSGSVFFTHAANGLQPTAGFAGAGTVQVAARHYLATLHQELAGTGVLAATIAVNALIENSTMAALAQANFPADAFAQLPTVDPDELADLYWSLHTQRDTNPDDSTNRFEVVHPAAQAAAE